MLQVHPVPAFSDNYLWVIHDGSHAIAVDPGDAAPVIAFLESKQLALTAILCTHHHADHVGGVQALLASQGGDRAIPVYGPAREKIPARTHALREGDRVALAQPAVAFDVIDVPGHTAGHIAYSTPGMLFCGDTLFGCGCGRLFEGTPAQMLDSLGKLARLPAQTRVYCAHEYTMSNIRFAEAVEPDNGDLAMRKAFSAAKRHRGEPTLPSPLGLETATNPFLRAASPGVRAAAEAHAGHALATPVDVFATLREWKNNF